MLVQHLGTRLPYETPRWQNLRRDILEVFQDAQMFVYGKSPPLIRLLMKAQEGRTGFNTKDRFTAKCLRCDRPVAHRSDGKHMEFCHRHLSARERAKMNQRVQQRVPGPSDDAVVIHVDDLPPEKQPGEENVCWECGVKHATTASLRSHLHTIHKIRAYGIAQGVVKVAEVIYLESRRAKPAVLSRPPLPHEHCPVCGVGYGTTHALLAHASMKHGISRQEALDLLREPAATVTAAE